MKEKRNLKDINKTIEQGRKPDDGSKKYLMLKLQAWETKACVCAIQHSSLSHISNLSPATLFYKQHLTMVNLENMLEF